jgi:type I restriction enzyme S subunit
MSTSQDFSNYVCGPEIHNRYLMQLFRFMQPEWQRLMAGSTHQTIYMPIFEKLQVLLPSLSEQERISDIAEVMDARIEAEKGFSDSLRGLKAALMGPLLTGKLRVIPDEATA